MKSNSIVYVALINIIFFMNFSPLQAMAEDINGTYSGPCTIDMEESCATTCSNCCSRCINNYECTKFCTYCCGELHKEMTEAYNEAYNEQNRIACSARICIYCVCCPLLAWMCFCDSLRKYQRLNQPINSNPLIKRAHP